MTTTTMNATIATTRTATNRRGQHLAQLKEDLRCWTLSRADMARMQREIAAEYKAERNL